MCLGCSASCTYGFIVTDVDMKLSIALLLSFQEGLLAVTTLKLPCWYILECLECFRLNWALIKAFYLVVLDVTLGLNAW